MTQLLLWSNVVPIQRGEAGASFGFEGELDARWIDKAAAHITTKRMTQQTRAIKQRPRRLKINLFNKHASNDDSADGNNDKRLI